jgi:hypothetical protein
MKFVVKSIRRRLAVASEITLRVTSIQILGRGNNRRREHKFASLMNRPKDDNDLNQKILN